MRRSVRMLVMLGATAALAAFAVACGGDDDTDDSSSGQSDASASASSSASASPGSSEDASATSSPSPEGSATTDGGSATASTTNSAGGTATPENNGQSGSSPTPAPTAVGRAFTAAEGQYCDTVSATSPPNTVLGLLKLGGTDTAAGTEVMVAFDDVPGPAEVTVAAGGYRVDFGVATGDECANKSGAKISIVINGQAYDTGATVGEAVATRFDIQN